MIQLVIVRNPFDVTKRETQEVVCRDGMPLSSYFCEPGRWQYSINGMLCEPSAVPADGDCIVIVPHVVFDGRHRGRCDPRRPLDGLAHGDGYRDWHDRWCTCLASQSSTD